MSLTSGELCAGYGGLALAVEEAFGATTAWFSEFDAAPSKILAHHWPDVPNHGDMTAIDWLGIEQVDVISGGTPCQDLSAAGRRKGMTAGTRSNLWVHMREAIATQQPEWVVWENVRGAYSANASSDLEQCPGCLGDTGNGEPVLRALGRVLGDLSDLGYDTEWRGLRAADVGACHGRFRVFVLARRRFADAGGQGLEIGGTQGITRRQDASAAALGDPAHAARAHDGKTRDPHTGRFAPLTDANRVGIDGAGKRPEQNGRGQSADSRFAPSDAEGQRWREGWTEPAGQLRGLATASDRAPTPDANGGDDDGRLGDAQRGKERGETTARTGEGTDWGDYEPAIRRWEAQLGRSAPRPTEPTGRNGGERLSPRFTEWMMGLPDGWVTDPAIGITRNEQLKACGNGVVPQQAIAALRDMLNAFLVNA